jgi:hypothetical protein
MSKHGQFSEAEAQSPVCVFLAQVFAANAGKVESWFGQLNGGTEDQKSSLALVLWMVGSSGSYARLRSLGQVGSGGFQNYVRGLLADDHRPDFLHDAIKNAGFLDDLWASFFASGDERYVKRIIGALQLANVHGDTGKLLIGGAAKWSLTSNAFQHPKVMQICEAELNQLPEDQRITLTQVIQSAREHKP